MGKFTTTKYICDGCDKEILPANPDMPGSYILKTENPYQIIFCQLAGEVLCDECFKKRLKASVLMQTYIDAKDAEKLLKTLMEGEQDDGGKMP